MAETIKGGAYKSADGSWQDANGKPLPAHVIQQLEEQERQREAEPEAEAPLPPAAVHFVAPTASSVIDEEAFLRKERGTVPVAKPKSKRKTKGSK